MKSPRTLYIEILLEKETNESRTPELLVQAARPQPKTQLKTQGACNRLPNQRGGSTATIPSEILHSLPGPPEDPTLGATLVGDP